MLLLSRMSAREAAPPPPPHLCFGMNTLSFLYSFDHRLVEVRSVPLDKLFCLSMSPSRMQFVHDQVSTAF